MITKRINVTNASDILTKLHSKTFPWDTVPVWKANALAWVTYNEVGTPCAFLYVEPSKDCWYFSRVGVLECARGVGLQRRLMKLMYRALKGEVIVSTTLQNPPSANNFVREQWMIYLPAYPWGSADTIYWMKKC